MKTFRVTLNYKGEVNNFIVGTENKKKALNYSIILLSRKLGKDYYPLRYNFYGQRDNFKITEIKKERKIDKKTT